MVSLAAFFIVDIAQDWVMTLETRTIGTAHIRKKLFLV